MSLFNKLRELSRKEKIYAVLTLENGNVIDSCWPGSHLKNLNNFLLELDQYVNNQQIVKIEVDGYRICFE